MKRLLCLLSLILVIPASSVLSQTEKRLPGTTGAVGPVKTIRLEIATFSKQNGAVIEGPRVLLQTVAFNENGTEQERVIYAPTGQVTQRIVDIYEPDGRVTESRVFHPNGLLARRRVTLYDDQKRRTEMVTYDANGAVMGRITFRQTDNKIETEGVGYDRGLIYSQSRSTTDLKSHQIESTSISQNGVIQTQSGFTDKPDGSQEWRSERSNGEFEWATTKGDGRGTVNQVIYNRDGTIKSRERLVREYDPHHNVIKSLHLSAPGDSEEYQPVEVTYGTFTYYEKNQ
jgi:hypothetical protein